MAAILGDITSGLSALSSADKLFGSDGSKGQMEWSAWQAQLQRNAALGMQEQAQDFNHDEAYLNREFQSSMRSTQYQTAVADMQAAGLNPMLAYQNGGAGNLSGSAASSGVSSVSGAQLPSNVKPAMLQSSTQAAQLYSTLQIQRAQADNIDADTKLKEAQVPYVAQQTATSAADAALKGTQQSQVDAAITLIGKQVRNTVADTDLKEAQAGVAEAQNRVLMATVDKVKAETSNLGLTAQQISAVTAKTLAEEFNITQLAPGLVNDANVNDSWYGRNIRPYLGDFLGLTRGAAQGAAAGAAAAGAAGRLGRKP